MNIYQRLLEIHINIRHWDCRPGSSFVYSFFLMKDYSLLKKQCVWYHTISVQKWGKTIFILRFVLSIDMERFLVVM